MTRVTFLRMGILKYGAEMSEILVPKERSLRGTFIFQSKIQDGTQ